MTRIAYSYLTQPSSNLWAERQQLVDTRLGRAPAVSGYALLLGKTRLTTSPFLVPLKSESHDHAATDPCSHKPRTPRPHPPPAPSLLGAVVDRTPQTHRGAGSLQTSGEEGLTDKQLGTLAFHEWLASVGVGMPAVGLRQSTRESTPSVRLRLLPDHVARAPRAPRAAPAPLSARGRRVRR